MLDVETLTIGQTIAFDYARRTKSGISGRIGVIEAIRPAHIVIKEIIGDTDDTIQPVQYRQFHKSCMVNIIGD